jgi:protein-S-isoprenylcysteine O-methyltransferase Ste14
MLGYIQHKVVFNERKRHKQFAIIVAVVLALLGFVGLILSLFLSDFGKHGVKWKF